MRRELNEYSNAVLTSINNALDSLLPQENTYPGSIHTLMRYSVFAGGKRVRPCLLYASHELCGGAFGSREVQYTGAAIEMLHTFSLIHDDLPCMDNDNFRRGKPTAHKAFGEALAVLGGDALCIYAFEILSRVGSIPVIKEIAVALGTGGMIGGQVVDIESEGRQVDRATVEYIHRNKTAALIHACVIIGAMLANASSDDISLLSLYGNHVGMAFQVVDDILDEEGTTQSLGKDAGSDRERGKATFPAVCGIEASKQYAKELVERAHENVKPFGEKAFVLHMIADFIRERLF